MGTIRAVVFDGGDTVIRVFPEYAGPMVDWPRLETVPGVEDALRTLKGRYRLATATNAADSDAELVRAALVRVGLGDVFEVVLAARDMGVRKPERAFYEQVVAALSCAPQEAVMVGDDYRLDVAGARAVGLHAIWFNPAGAACPVSPPVHDAEVRSMAELPAAVERLGMPEVEMVAVLPGEREALEVAFDDWERHFADLIGQPGGHMARGLDGDPFEMPGRDVCWLQTRGRRCGFVVMDTVDLPASPAPDAGGPPAVEAIKIRRYGVFPEYRGQGLGSAGLPLLEARAVQSRRPLTWGCWLMNPALRFWERWADDLARQRWRIERRPRESTPPARLYIAWPPGET